MNYETAKEVFVWDKDEIMWLALCSLFILALLINNTKIYFR